jgi:Domain of unknown function (DUF4304)
MDQSDRQKVFRSYLAATKEKIAPLGYRLAGTTFRKIVDGNAGIISFQRSQQAVGVTRLTINVEIICGPLLEAWWQPELSKAGAGHGHLRERIGFLMPQKADIWWTIGEAADGAEFRQKAEVVDAVVSLGVPYIDRHIRTADLIAIWRSGVSPCITETQRVRYLSELESLKGS